MFDVIASPFAHLLMIFYDLTGSYGLALILFATVVKVALLPFQMKAKKGQMKQSRLQPKIAEIQKKHGANRAKLSEETQKLWKEEGVNPASGCIWGLLPLPIMFALFQAIRQPISLMMGVPRYLIEEGGAIYERIHSLGFHSTVQQLNIELDYAQFITSHWEQFYQWATYGLQAISFNLGPLNLGQQPQWTFFWNENTDWSHVDGWLPGLLLFLVPVISAGMQFISAAITRKTQPTPQIDPNNPGAGKGMQTMMMLMPLMSLWFGFMFPAALGFYWTTGTVLQIFQDLWLNKRYTKILDAEDEVRNAARKAKEAEIEAKRLESERKKAEGIVETNANKSKRNKQRIEKQERLDKAAEWERKNAPPSTKEEVDEPSRVGKRRNARGRAYDPNRYPDVAAPVSGDLGSADDDEIEEKLIEAGAVDEDGNVVGSVAQSDSDDSYDEHDDDFEEDDYDDDDYDDDDYEEDEDPSTDNSKDNK